MSAGAPWSQKRILNWILFAISSSFLLRHCPCLAKLPLPVVMLMMITVMIMTLLSVVWRSLWQWGGWWWWSCIFMQCDGAVCKQGGGRRLLHLRPLFQPSLAHSCTWTNTQAHSCTWSNTQAHPCTWLNTLAQSYTWLNTQADCRTIWHRTFGTKS